MDDLTNDRKLEHINIVNQAEKVDRKKNFFDRIHLVHRALPEIDFDEVDTSITFMDKQLSFPLLISSMTGGAQEIAQRINKNLALAAEETGVALGLGSQRVMFTHPKARPSFEMRQYAPSALLIANLGAVQLNYGFGLEQCRDAIQTVGADALYFHLNPLQEAVQPEGDTKFSGLAEKIGEMALQLEQPVIIKEVGAGIGVKDIELLIRHGIRYIDVAGCGGTSWSRIENFRRDENTSDDLGLLFQDWGNPTPLLLRAMQPFLSQISVVASGGLRSGVDMAKAVILGARLCGMAKPFLKPAMESPEAVIQIIRQLHREYKTVLFLLGIKRTNELHLNESLMWNPGFSIYE